MSQAPIARADTGTDPYRWLENRDAEDVLAYLRAENIYLEQQLADQAELRETLFQEIKGRIRETDLSLPSPWVPGCITSAPRLATSTHGTTAARVRWMVR